MGEDRGEEREDEGQREKRATEKDKAGCERRWEDGERQREGERGGR